MGNYIISCRCGLSIGVSCVEGRELRSKKNVNYLELANLQLPSTRRKHHLDTSKLFSVHILETDEVDEEDSEDGSSVTSCFQPYSWYKTSVKIRVQQWGSLCHLMSSSSVEGWNYVEFHLRRFVSLEHSQYKQMKEKLGLHLTLEGDILSMACTYVGEIQQFPLWHSHSLHWCSLPWSASFFREGDSGPDSVWCGTVECHFFCMWVWYS